MRKLSLTILFLLVSSRSFATTPTVTGVAGTVATGNVLVVSGTNMVNEDVTNWAAFAKNGSVPSSASGFEGTDWVADGYQHINPTLPCGNLVARCWDPTYDTSTKLMGNKSIHFHVQAIDTTDTNLTSYTRIPNGIGKNVWIRMYVRWHFSGNGGPSSHMKMMDTDASGLKQTYWQPDAAATLNMWQTKSNVGAFSNVSGYNYTFGSCVSNCTLIHFANTDGAIQLDRWYAFEVYVHFASAPYTADVYVDGKQILHDEYPAESAITNLQMGLINLSDHNYSTDPALNSNIDHWWDGFATSASRIYPASTIEISNNATYGAGTLVYQVPEYLSDGSVSVKANLTGLGAGPYYLFVTNNRQETSSAYNLSGAQVKQLKAPQNLRAN